MTGATLSPRCNPPSTVTQQTLPPSNTPLQECTGFLAVGARQRRGCESTEETLAADAPLSSAAGRIKLGPCAQDELDMDKQTFREQYSEDPKREDLTVLVPKQDDPTEQVPVSTSLI